MKIQSYRRTLAAFCGPSLLDDLDGDRPDSFACCSGSLTSKGCFEAFAGCLNDFIDFFEGGFKDWLDGFNDCLDLFSDCLDGFKDWLDGFNDCLDAFSVCLDGLVGLNELLDS